MIHIYFLEKSFPFNGNDLNSSIIAGSEKTLINIANKLASKKDINVKVFNSTNNEQKINNVDWININRLNSFPKPEIVISMSNMGLFPNYSCKKFLWSHSIQSLEKFIRKGQLIPFIKHRPRLILESFYHYNNRSYLTSAFGKDILKICADIDFINADIDKNKIPPNNVIFNTRSDRNLNLVLKAWRDIKSEVHDAVLYINPPFNLSDEDKSLDIKIREKNNKFDLIKDLSNMKLMLNPGHKGEVFCLVAEEGRVMCVPIVTLGIGALSERVDDKITGFICKDLNDFVKKSIDILNNNNLYLQIKSNLFDIRNMRNYEHVVEDLLGILKIKF